MFSLTGDRFVQLIGKDGPLALLTADALKLHLQQKMLKAHQ